MMNWKMVVVAAENRIYIRYAHDFEELYHYAAALKTQLGAAAVSSRVWELWEGEWRQRHYYHA